MSGASFPFGPNGGFAEVRFDRAAFDQPPAAPPDPLTPKVELNDPPAADAPRKPAKRRPRARTNVGRAVLENADNIALIGASFIALIDSRIEEVRQKRPNSDEAMAADERKIADYEDLRRRVEAFLGAASQFSAKKVKETAVVVATTSFAEGIGNWWTKKHVQICDQAFQVGMFGIGVAICSLAGAGGPLSAAIPGAMLGGKPVAQVIKDCLKSGRR